MQISRITSVLAVACLLAASIADVRGQMPPNDAAAARAEIERLLAEAESTPPDLGFAEALRVEGDRYEHVARLIAAFLKAHPDDPSADLLTVQRFRALYWTATARGHELDPLRAAVEEVDVQKARPALREAVSYWQARLARAELIRQAVAQGENRPATGPTARLEEFDGSPERVLDEHARRYPTTPTGAAIIATRAKKALERGDLDQAENWIALLEKNQSRDVSLESLRGEAQLRRRIGEVWAPPLKTVDKSDVDWPRLRGRICLVVFWSPRVRPSVTLIRRVTAFMAEHSDDVSVIAIGIDDDAPAATKVLSDLGFVGSAVHDGLGWRSPLAREYGVRLLPTVLFLDREGRLAHIERLGRRQLVSEVIAQLDRMTRGVPSTPADSQPTTPDDGIALPSGD